METDNTGSHVEYGCVRGYVLQDPTQSGLDCQNGVWTGIWPICGKCTIFDRPPDKSVYWKIIFFISNPKHMLWVLKRTVSLRRFF